MEFVEPELLTLSASKALVSNRAGAAYVIWMLEKSKVVKKDKEDGKN